MISKYISVFTLLICVSVITGCSETSGSNTSKATIQVAINAAPSPVNVAAMPAGSKTFLNDLGDSITINKAYLVISSTTIETTCGASFSAAAEGVLDMLIPIAHAHTSSTPTSTGEPSVVNILAVDGGLVDIGDLSPSVADYCGVDIDMLAADVDTANLPSGVGEPDMIGKTLFIEGTYAQVGGATGNITLSTGATLINRDLLLSVLLSLSASNLTGVINIGINYDTWFNSIDLVTLETETAVSTNPADTNVSQVLQNITKSIHQL